MRVAVIGGGMSGISMAYWLLRSPDPSLEVHLFEREPAPGGLCATVERDGFLFDFGPHNVHSIYPAFNDFVRSLLGEEYRDRVFKPQVVFRDSFIPYPMKGLDILRGVSPWTSASCAASFLFSRIESLFKPWRDESFEDFIVNRFGRRLYDIYFGPFTLKTWGVPGSRISSDFGRERIGVFTLWDLFKRTFLGIRPRESEAEEDPFLNSKCVYPDKGSGRIVGTLLEECLRDERFSIRTGSAVDSLGVSAGLVRSVGCAGDRLEDVDICFSSISIPAVSELLGLPGTGLEYTSTRFVMLRVNRPRVFAGAPWVYFADDRTRFNRVCEMSSMSDMMAPPGKSSLCVEFTSTGSDATWSASPEELLDASVAGLARYGLLDASSVIGWDVLDRRDTYPLRLVGYRERLAEAAGRLARFGNLVSHGRLGGFAYLNMDHCFLESRRLAGEFLTRRAAGPAHG